MSGVERIKRLTKAEADALADQFLESLLRMPPTGKQGGPENVGALAHLGLRLFDDSPPRISETAPQYVRSLFQPFMDPENRIGDEAGFKKFKQDLSPVRQTTEGIREFVSSRFRRMSPGEVEPIRDLIKQLTALADDPLRIRNDLITTIKKSMKGQPGPKHPIGSEQRTAIAKAADRLRPVCRKILDFSKNESQQPMRTVVEAVRSLHPEWTAECDFLLSNLNLIAQSLNLAKIRKAKVRGKASKLADALAGRFIGRGVAPAYSMQLAELARRNIRKGN